MLIILLNQFPQISVIFRLSCACIPYSIIMQKSIEIHLPNQQKREFFDQFVFVDKLTNRSIAIRQIKRCSSIKKVKCHQPRFSEKQQLKQLDDCIAILHQTNAFKKQNLKEKLFGNSNKSIEQNIESQDNITKKKRLIRSMLNEGINNINKQEFSQYLSSNSHKPDVELLKYAKDKAYPISKNKVKEIVGALSKKENVFGFRKHTQEATQQDILTKKLNILQTQIQAELRQKLRKTGQFLIEPKRSFLPIKTLRNYKLSHSSNPNIKQSQIKIIEQLKWKQASLQNSQLTYRPRKALCTSNRNHVNSKTIHIFDIVSKGSVQDVEIAVGKHGLEVTKMRDSEGNSLLHVAAKLAKTLIFEYLLKCRGIQGLLQKNNEGDTPIDLACRLQNYQIIKFVPASLI